MSRLSATSASRGSHPCSRWIAWSAGISEGPGKRPARASVPGTRPFWPAISARSLPRLPGLGQLGVAVGGRLDPHGAELELRDLAEGIDLVDGQQVRGRLAEVERDEARARRLTVREARRELGRTAAARDVARGAR